MQSDLQDFLKLAPPELVDVPDAFRSSLRSSETWSDEDVKVAQRILTDCGVLVQRDNLSFIFALPGMGPFFNEIMQGRREILNVISKRRFSEMLVREIEKIRLRFSTLGMRFHLRDVIGHGNIEICETTTGPLLKFHHF
mmetsp:Transcript_31252/g.100254  ORF Transcript_31252/g.100254 Transcript_31252/m.100254 type:complete len:139 (+) Transcript_31252:675-1091(+)